MLKKILEVILFIAFVLFYYSVLPVIVVVISLCKGSFILCHKYWSDFGVNLLKINMIKMADSKEINKKDKTMVLINHRSWSDFFTHDIVAEYSANFVSRMAVGLVFPSILILSNISRTIFFFKRGGKNDKKLES